MKLIVLITLFFTFSTTLQSNSDTINTKIDEDYLAEFKKQMQLKWPNNKTMNVVFHGHSVPSGYSTRGIVNTLAAYPHLFLKFLKEQYPTAVVNCITTSIGGEQSEQGAKRFKDDVLCMKPDLLFIDYALNDRGIGLERAEKAWRSMINDALNVNIKLVLLTPTPDIKEDILDDNTTLAGYANMIKKLGEEFDIPVVDVYAQFKKMRQNGEDLTKYMAQNNHPNELGHQVAVQEIIKKLFSEIQ
ncbi:SGNH/GDSL hydrolase family protein [Draconibacterium sediminis]|uniref:SGNH/GDSL hydrolase family protein n=1 Tax=Draconibacterium sediminis TaxID=1544798 RepID=UPI0009E4FC15|nr:SGNH/GDSL hydrolase family protein [Draconibacterium sediminis]